MIVDVFPPTDATQVDWLRVVTYEPQRAAADPPERTIVRVHLLSGQILEILVPERSS